MPVYEVVDPNGRKLRIEGDQPPSDMELDQIFAQQEYPVFGATSQTPQEELDPYADERTALGQAGEFGKGAVRGFAGSFLTAAEGLAELADAGTNALGFEDLIDSGDENALVSAAKAGQEVIQENLGADQAYRDQWLTKFGEGVGSFASFFTPAGAVKALGLTGKLASGVQLGAAGTLAGGVGAGEQAQRIQRARDQGIEVSEGQEDAAIGLSTIVGLTELAPVSAILGRISKNAKPEFVNSIKERLLSASKSGFIEGIQEVGANIAQDAIERGVYNENLETDMSLSNLITSDEFTIGGATGFAADLVLNAVSNRRGKLANQAEKDHENLLRSEQDKRVADGRQAVTDLQQQEAEEAQKQAEAEVTGEIYVPPVQSLEGLQPIPRPAESTTGNIDYEHADAIKVALGRDFPTEGSFDARVTDNGTYEVVANLPDVAGEPQEPRIVANNLETADQAGIVSGRLNQKVMDANISRTVNKVIDNAQPIENYNQDQKDTLAVVGDTIMHPNGPTTLIPATRLNSAAETTVEKGFREDLSATQVMQLNTQGESISMTAAQKINESRVNQGLPEKADFTLKEIRESGFVSPKKFDQLIPSLAPANSFSADTQIKVFEPKNDDGTPELKSDGTPVKKRRATHTVIGKDEQGNDVRVTERPRTARDIETGSKFTPKSRPVKIKSAKEAKAIAAEMNASSGLGRKFQNVQGELVDLSTAKTPKQKLAVINQVLSSKNISNDINSPEMGVVVEQFVGAKPKKVESLKASEFQAVVAGLRSLPRFNSPTKIPKFTIEESAKPAAIASAIPRNMSLVPFTPVDVSPIEEVLPEAQVADINALRKRLRGALNKFGLKDIGVSLEKSLGDAAMNSNNELVFGVYIGTKDGKTVAERSTEEESAQEFEGIEALYRPATSTIFSSVDMARSEAQFANDGKPVTEQMVENQLISTLHHEMLHAMRDLDLFTNKEWRLLTDYVTKNKMADGSKTYLEDAQQRYGDTSQTTQVEEAVAELVREAVGGTKKVSGKPRSLINRIVEFFKGLVGASSQDGFTTIESLIGGISSGAVGGRSRGVQRTLRETEKRSGIPQYDSETGTTNFQGMVAPAVAQTGQSIPDFIEPDQAMASRRRSSSPIQSAVERATTKYADYNTAVEEEFFGNFWPKMMQEVGGTVSPNKVRTASKRALRDIQTFVSDNPKYQDYYAEDMRAVRLALSEDYGDISDGDLLFYQIANGLSSPATSLPANVGDAINIFDLYKKEGNLESIELGTSPKGNVVVASSPFSISGTTAPTKARSLKVVDRLIAEKGGAVEAVEFLREGVSPKELQKFNREMGYKSNVSGMGAIKSLVQQATGQNESIPRMFIFGKKIGAYTLNLTGDSRYTTIDVWESRFIRSYFDGLFRQNTGLPANVSEDQLFQDFSTMFKEEYDKFSGTKADPAALQAMRWFYMINAAKQSGYQGASTSETISELTNKYLTKTRERRNAGRAESDGATAQEVRDPSQAREESLDQPLESRARSIAEFIKSNPEGFTVDPNTFETPTGVAVAPIKNLEIRVLPEEINDDVIDQAVRNFKAMADTLDRPVYLGGWFSSEDGYYYLDGSITVDSVEEALYIAEAGDQLGIFDLNTFEETLTNEGIRKLKENGTYDDKAASIARRNKEELDRIFGAQGNTGQAQQEGLDQPLASRSRAAFRSAGDVAILRNQMVDDLEAAGVMRGELVSDLMQNPLSEPELNSMSRHGRALFKAMDRADFLGFDTIDDAFSAVFTEDLDNFDMPQGLKSALGTYVNKEYGLSPQKKSTKGKREAEAFLSKGSTPRDNITTIPEEAIEAVVAKNIADAEATTATSIPLYSVKAEPRAQYVAQNPEKGSRIIDETIHSRSRAPNYSPEAKAEISSLVNATMPDKTAREVYLEATDQSSIGEMLTRFKQKAINKYARLENIYTDPKLGFRDVLADSSAMAAALFADRAQGVSSAAIKGGVATYNNGITKVEKFVHNGKEYRGLIDVMAPLVQNNYNVNLEELAQAYAVAERSQGLIERQAQRKAKAEAEGVPFTEKTIKTPANAQSLTVLKAEIAKYTNPETGQPIIQEWYSAWQAYNAKTIQFLRDTGVLDAETAQVWADQSDYVPFYRQLEEEGGSQMPPVFTGMTSAANFKALKGGDTAVNVPLLEAVTRNLNAAIHMGMKNVAQQRIVRDMSKMGLAYEVKGDMKAKNVISFRVDGKNRKFSISDPLIYESMQGMGSGEVETMLTNIVGAPSTVLRELITRSPSFMIVNMMRDTMSTFVTSGANFTPVVDTLKNFNSGSDLLEQYGVVGGYDFGNDPKDIYSEFNTEVKKRNGMGINPFKSMWNFLGQKTTQSDAATRKAVYDDVLARTGNEAEAAFQALEVINFSRRGSSGLARVVTAAIPFLNARFQGLDVLWRSATGRYSANKDQSKAEQTRNFIFRGLMLTGISAAYWLMVSDDDQYKEQSEFVRDNNFILPNPFSDKYPLMLPIPFEIGLIFKTLPERILGVANKETNFVEDVLGLEGRGKTTRKEAVDSAVRGLTSTLEINPLGAQFVAPLIEASLNYDFFTGKNVESVFMNENNLEKAFRQRVGSSQMAVFLGEKLNLSPIKIDHVMQGYTGTLGIYALNAMDAVLRSPTLLDGDNPLKVEGSDELASMTLDRAPFLKRFLGSEFGRKNMDDYYEIRAEVKRTVGTLDTLRDGIKMDQYRRYLQGREHIVGLKGSVNYLDGLLKATRKQIEAVQTAEDITPERKAEIIREIEQARSEYLKQVPVLKEALNSPAKLPAVGGLYRD